MQMTPTRSFQLLSSLVAFAALVFASPSLADSITAYEDVIYDVGYVSADGAPLVYTQSFEPAETNVEIVGAWLQVTVVDDICYQATFPNCEWSDLAEPEWIDVSVGGTPVDGGYVGLIESFGGEITAEANLQGWGDTAQITATATEGDAWVAKSRMVVAYRVLDDFEPRTVPGDTGPSVPEPSAALVFALGAVLVRRATRRR